MEYIVETTSKTVCDPQACCACYACESICPKKAIQVIDQEKNYRAEIDGSQCMHCGLCYSVCPNIHLQELVSPLIWKQGWTRDEVRASSSSGGLAYAISEGFILHGGSVVACTFYRGLFTYKLIDTIEALGEIQGSKYIKSNPKSCYSLIMDNLKKGKNTLFIGLPCQVAAVKNYTGEKYADRLFTIDLICHGSPSPNVLEDYLASFHINLSDINHISFRNKSRFRLQIAGEPIAPYGLPDPYTIAFMEALCYTENCYECRYASLNRVSDITLGDSWGTELTNEETKGVSLVLCQTEKGRTLLHQADCTLLNVDLDKAVSMNRQLKKPSTRPACYDQFFATMKEKNLTYAVMKYRKKIFVKQLAKKLAISFHILNKDEL